MPPVTPPANALDSLREAGLQFCTRWWVQILVCAALGVMQAWSLSAGIAPSRWWAQLLALMFLAWFAQHAMHEQQRPLRVALLGFSFGIGWFGAGIWWIFISLHKYGGMPAAAAAGGVAVLALYLALFPAFALWCIAWVRIRITQHGLERWGNLLLPFAFGCLWAGSEWLRGQLFSGFPWINSGTAHVHSPWDGMLPLIGAYGLCLMVATLAWAIAAPGALEHHTQKQRQRLGFESLAVFLIVGVLGTILPWLPTSNVTPQGGRLTVALHQGNIAQDVKFAQTKMQVSYSTYLQMLSGQQSVDLAVLPETALPPAPMSVSYDVPNDVMRALQLEASRTPVLTGMVTSKAKEQAPLRRTELPYHVYNSVVQVQPLSSTNANPQANAQTNAQATPPASEPNQPLPAERPIDWPHYHKHHLLPFGELIPPWFQWFMDMANIPLASFSEGALAQPPFVIKGVRIAANVCYEDLFGEQLAAQLRANDAGVLLNVSNLAWFDDSWALAQHLQASRTRARELGRPMVRATNTGYTAIITPDGQVQSYLPVLQRGTLVDAVQPFSGTTPYVRWGNAPVVLLACGVWLALLFAYAQRLKLLRRK